MVGIAGGTAEYGGWDDDTLLSLLSDVFDELDPVPDDVVARARAVFTRRSVPAGAEPSGRPGIDQR